MRRWIPHLSLLVLALVLFALPARFEGPVIIPISPGHGLSLVDLAAVVPLLVAQAMVATALVQSRDQLQSTIRRTPWAATAVVFTGGAGLGLLLASVFPFFWWWAIGAALLTVTLAVAVLASAGRLGAAQVDADSSRN